MPKWNQPKINMQGCFVFFVFLLFLCFSVFLLAVELHYEVTAVTESVLFAEPSDDLPDN